MDKEQPINRRVSIVIPVYNSSKTLPKCLDSMIAQTYKDLEIICVNDCSKDNSLEIIKEYQLKDSRVKLINHKENMNAGGARNSGIRAATGTYVCFVDNDDWMVPDAVDILVNASSNFNADYVVSDWIDYFSDTNQTVVRNLPLSGDRDEKIAFVCKNGLRMLGCLIKKDLFTLYNLYYPEKIFYEDNAISIPLFCMSRKINYASEAIYYYAHSVTSVTGFTTKKKLLDRMKTQDMLISNFKRLGIYEGEISHLVNFYYSKLLAQTIRLALYLGWRDGLPIVREVADKLSRIKPIQYHAEMPIIFKPFINTPLMSYFYYKIRMSIGKLIRHIK